MPVSFNELRVTPQVVCSVLYEHAPIQYNGTMFIGVDGGGTYTSFLLIDHSGMVKAEYKGASSNYLQCGFEGTYNVLDTGITTLLRQSNCSRTEITGVIVGLGAFGEITQDMPELVSVVRRATQGMTFRLVNDVVIGWAGSLGLAAGIHVVAGTGSIAYANNAQGDDLRCGGWGHMIGDEGSAYWIAKEAITCFTKQSDGRMQRTRLYERLETHFSLANDFDMIDVFATMDRTQTAALCKVIFQAADEGCVISRALFARAAKELALMVRALSACNTMKDVTKVSSTGGVFNAGAYILDPFIQEIEALHCTYVPPLLTPVRGAALMAAVELGKLDATAVLGNLRT